MKEIEVCAECESEVEKDLAENEFSFTCPHCGKCVMACSKCIFLQQQANNGKYTCDWDKETNTCFRNRK